jgi:hypothetical protein
MRPGARCPGRQKRFCRPALLSSALLAREVETVAIRIPASAIGQPRLSVDSWRSIHAKVSKGFGDRARSSAVPAKAKAIQRARGLEI